MARAEYTGVSSLVRAETCGHFMCSCKLMLDDQPIEAYIASSIGVDNSRIYTSLRLITDGHQKMIEVPGVRRPEEISDAFNACEGPEITATGVVCGAIYRLGGR